MSDTRSEAEQELNTVTMTADLEDSLGSALETSFNIPTASSKPSQFVPDEIPSNPTGPAATAIPNEVPGMDEWKDTYEHYLEEWHAESAVAREKAEKTRKRIEDERAAEAKAAQDKVTAEKKKKQDEEKKKRDQERLKRELEEEMEEGSKKRHGKSAEREKKVKEAWELVKGGESSEAASTAVKQGAGVSADTDGRGVTEADIAGGQAIPTGHHKKPIQPTAYDPTTSQDPIPPVMQDAKSPAPISGPTDSTTLSRHSGTSQAWEEISGPSSSATGSGSGEEVSPPRSTASNDLVNVPSKSAAGGSGGEHPSPPSQPPSLTLSIFTMPSHLTISRVVAVLGINLVLPFINGVMLGFGEIFAREVVRVGKAVWRGERALFNAWGNRGQGLGGRGSTGVGLSGSGGF
ncbi:hypothetical protein CI109_104014 [Kwoniella shandongensis]|uniref:Uncharacterized protein n=1 Tax=Kwoniella shandongensis TaxID=1734106 RepID=A0A5M6C0L5_9TREE|nr:uncharacterized protein CI109_004101 [Kwoniella shandongensis]KAA5527562.1 hypothetical protein CI109_004101 [Kwoniella shandongensis]